MTDKLSQNDFDSLIAPGKVLRDKRQQMGLSQADVATRLHLSVQTVKDIEADDYTHFSAAIYVRGYIRSFASLVGVASEPLLDAFVKMGFVNELNKEPRTSYIASSVTKTVRMHYSRRRIASWMSYVFFIFLITLVVVWWHGQRNHRHATISTSLLSAVTQAQSKPLNTPPAALTTPQQQPNTLPVAAASTQPHESESLTQQQAVNTAEERAALDTQPVAVSPAQDEHQSLDTTQPVALTPLHGHRARQHAATNEPSAALPVLPAPASLQPQPSKDE